MFLNQFKKAKANQGKNKGNLGQLLMIKQTKLSTFYQTVTVVLFISKRSTESQERSTILLNANVALGCDLVQEPSKDPHQRCA